MIIKSDKKIITSIHKLFFLTTFSINSWWRIYWIIHWLMYIQWHLQYFHSADPFLNHFLLLLTHPDNIVVCVEHCIKKDLVWLVWISLIPQIWQLLYKLKVVHISTQTCGIQTQRLRENLKCSAFSVSSPLKKMHSCQLHEEEFNQSRKRERSTNQRFEHSSLNERCESARFHTTRNQVQMICMFVIQVTWSWIFSYRPEMKNTHQILDVVYNHLYVFILDLSCVNHFNSTPTKNG